MHICIIMHMHTLYMFVFTFCLELDWNALGVATMANAQQGSNRGTSCARPSAPMGIMTDVPRDL